MARDELYAGKIYSEKGFYVGDICYALKREIYDGIWGKKFEYAEGCFPDENTGGAFAVGWTAYGDGCYWGTDGFNYGVDAGVLGIISLELVDHNDGGRIIEGAGYAKYEFCDGHFKFTLPSGEMIEIETADMYDEEEELYEEYMDEEEEEDFDERDCD